ncbi:rhotekin isoform X2 [Cephus cinctus]|uniref:Rhotekin isoform X2 n=1 Tax=Cephus cinctus TaxID=211228 RepID=A0AAJ7RK46_CEPCN|nr:rhotekin isoform X2 [Cephus cinctus]
MYKIRLYVVPEQEETALDFEKEDRPNCERPLVQMQRRNSKRPGVVRVNVTQTMSAVKTRQSRDVTDDHVVRDTTNGNATMPKAPLHRGMCVAGDFEKLPDKMIFASPKIQRLALNLQEKMLERTAKMQKISESVDCGVLRNFENFGNKKVPPAIRRRADNNDRSVSCSLTPISENLHGNGDDGFLASRSQVLGKSMKIGRFNNCPSNSNGSGDTLEKESPVKMADKGVTNSVILRRNNKLNGYRVRSEYDLEQKIEVEIKMREGSARLLAAARHRAQSLEAARALLTSNERMSAYMAELQRRKREPSNKSSLPGSSARVSLSELRVPLMWRDSDHFKNRGDYRRFAVFCLARVGTEIHDTALLCPVDRALTDISFPDVLVFNNVPAEFELTLEIYSHILQEDLSIASTPRRIKRTIHSSISKTVGKKLAASLRDELNSGKMYVTGPHFELMASAKLTLDDSDENIHTHDLVINNLENKHHALPLFGHFCCRLAAQPECVNKEVYAGSLNLDGRECWARLQGFSLQSWESRKLAEEEQNPLDTIPVNRETTVQSSKSSAKELRIVNTVDGAEKTSILRLECSEEAQKWLRHLVMHAQDHLRWKHAAESIQDVPCVESARNSFISNKRQGSLYDETPLIESVQSDYTTNRPTVQEIFGLTPSTSLSSCSSTSSPPSLRSRSLSTSGTRKLSGSALKNHWPFSTKSHD